VFYVLVGAGVANSNIGLSAAFGKIAKNIDSLGYFMTNTEHPRIFRLSLTRHFLTV
jgi:hypothetical protein